jgi:alginate O-acetyltransferase complex protein AlgI
MVLPLGISFFTFNLIGYAIDVYWGTTDRAPTALHLVAFGAFFPTVSSGPLIRYGDFANEEQFPRADEAQISSGVFRIVMGLAKKVFVADAIAGVINPLFGNYATLQLWGAWIAVVGFHLQVYVDFSGYSDIAIGIARLLGISIPENFDAPYTATSFTDFWQRWHMTLSHWFRDYFFLPLSRALLRGAKAISPAVVRTVSLVATMVLIGLWHGARWSYLLFGAYHGLVLAAHAVWRERRWGSWPSWLSRPATTIGLLLGWVIFRSTTPSMAFALAQALVGLKGVEAGPAAVAGVGRAFVVLIVLLLLATNVRRPLAYLTARPSWWYALGLAGIVILWVLVSGAPSPFFYFQF